MDLLYKVNGNDDIKFEGRILQLFLRPMALGDKKILFEYCRRSPGSRLILEDKKNKKILITKEYRYDTKVYDFRLPGGKVFDNFKEFDSFEKSGKDIIEKCKENIINEVAEECGYDIKDCNFYRRSFCGATIIWDLYYFISTKFNILPSKNLKDGEDIENLWLSYKEIVDLCVSGKVKEDRSIGVLLSYLINNKNL